MNLYKITYKGTAWNQLQLSFCFIGLLNSFFKCLKNLWVASYENIRHIRNPVNCRDEELLLKVIKIPTAWFFLFLFFLPINNADHIFKKIKILQRHHMWVLISSAFISFPRIKTKNSIFRHVIAYSFVWQ